MITDNQTNFLYFADTLLSRYSKFHDQLQTLLEQQAIPNAPLTPTKDIWAVDYMPVQITPNKFIQFVYNPDYLRDTAKWRKTISDVDAICSNINISIIKSDIVLDGGNVIRASNKVIMCNKVFKENPHYSEKELIKELERLLEVDKIIFIPTDTYDCIGHADGMVRFLDDNTVLINDYSKEDIDFQLCFRLSLYNAGLRYIEIPYNPYQNGKDIQANGIYINYLQMQQAVIVPIYELKDDETAIRMFEELFKGQPLLTLDSNEIADEGGVLNCISWNIIK